MFADPKRQLGIAYTVNKLMNPDWHAIDPRLHVVLGAFYRTEAAMR